MKKYLKFALAGSLIFVITGCDQVKNNLTTVFQSKSPQQITQEAEQAIADRNPQKAIEITKAFLSKNENGNDQMIYVAAQAYAEVGDVSKAISLLETLVMRGYIEKTKLINEEAFTSMKNDIRFISWLANISNTNLNVKESSPPANLGSAVSVEIGTSGVSAKAGNVSVKISN